MSLGRVLVTGGCGCLGYHIVSQLIDGKRAMDIAVLARRPDHNLVDGAQYFQADITRRSEVDDVFAKFKPTVVMHVAAFLPTTSKVNTFAVMQAVNIEGTRNVLEASQEVGTVKAFVYCSSPSVVHSGAISHRLNEADESLPVLRMPEQQQPYAHTKGIAEDLVSKSNGKNGMFTVSIRPAGLFGEADLQHSKPAIERARSGKAKAQIGSNTNLFDLTYVGNAAEAHILAAKALLRDPLPSGDMRVDGEAFFITNGDPRPFWDVARMHAAAAGCPVKKEEIKVIPVWLAFFMAGVMEWVYWIVTFGTKQPVMNRRGLSYTIMQRTFSIEKARKRLGYKPRVSLEEGMRREVVWYDKTFPSIRK